MTALSDWLHKLPPPQVQALRDFRRAARAAYPDDAAYLAWALDTGNAIDLLAPYASPLKKLSSAQEAAVILAMPREFVLALDH